VPSSCSERSAEVAGKDGGGKTFEVRTGRAILVEPGNMLAHKGKSPARAATELRSRAEIDRLGRDDELDRRQAREAAHNVMRLGDHARVMGA